MLSDKSGSTPNGSDRRGTSDLLSLEEDGNGDPPFVGALVVSRYIFMQTWKLNTVIGCSQLLFVHGLGFLSPHINIFFPLMFYLFAIYN